MKISFLDGQSPGVQDRGMRALVWPAAFLAACASAPRPSGAGTTPSASATATAAPASAPAQPFVDRPPSPIGGAWRVTCAENDGEVIEFTVDGNKAVGRVVELGVAKRYGFQKGEDVFRLTADSYGDWVGETRWRGVSGAQHWDSIRMVATGETLSATMTNEPCYRNMPKRR